jgi:hypothetical protein
LRPLTPERPPASVSDMHSSLAATMRALDLRGCEASPEHVGQQLDRKPMCYQECLCAAAPRTRCEQFECAPLIGGRLSGHQ